MYPLNREDIKVAEMAKACYSPAPKRQPIPVPRLSFHEEVEKLCNQGLTSPPASPLPAGSEPDFSLEEEKLSGTMGKWL